MSQRVRIFFRVGWHVRLCFWCWQAAAILHWTQVVGCRLKTKRGIMLVMHQAFTTAFDTCPFRPRTLDFRLVTSRNRFSCCSKPENCTEFSRVFQITWCEFLGIPKVGSPLVQALSYAATPSNAGGSSWYHHQACVERWKIPCGIMPNGSSKASSFLCCVSCRTDRTKEQNQTCKLKEITSSCVAQ
jgi:hypothetical protein